MPNALFAFDDREAAQRARDRLIEQGLPAGAVRLHAPDRWPDESVAYDVDEQATGGFVTNFFSLLRGLFEWEQSPHDVRTFEETFRRGGAVVDVDAASDAERERVDTIMDAERPTQRTGWSAGPGAYRSGA